jgi:drug/metabolite transporter (DMT)-like permease
VREEDKFTRWIYLAVLAVIWGSSFILMKVGLKCFDPRQVASIRLFVSWCALLPLVAHRFKEVKKEKFRFIFATGLLGNGIPAFLFAIAQTNVSSSLAGMLNSLTPVFVVLIGILFFKSVFKISQMLGVVTGLAGAFALILISSKANVFSGNAWFGLLIVLATICYGFSVTIIRTYLHHVDAVLITGFALFIAGIPSGIYLFTTDFISRFSVYDHVWKCFLSVVALGLLNTAFSTVLFNKLIKISNALYASSVTYLIPIVAILWGVLDGEIINWKHILAMLAILTGIYLINYEAFREMKRQKNEKLLKDGTAGTGNKN